MIEQSFTNRIASCKSVPDCDDAIRSYASSFISFLGESFFGSQSVAETVKLAARGRSASPDVERELVIATAKNSFFAFAVRLNLTLDAEKDRKAVEAMNGRYNECNLAPCHFMERGLRKTNVVVSNFFFNAWADRLSSLSCSTVECDGVKERSLASARSLARSSSNFLLSSVAIAGLVVSGALSLLAVASVIYALSNPAGLARNVLYFACAVATVVALLLRVVFWTVGLTGFGIGTGAFFDEAAFYYLDKSATLVFCFCMMIFVFMWAKAVHADVFNSTKMTHGFGVVLLGIGVALTVATFVCTANFLSNFSIDSRFMNTTVRDFPALFLSMFLVLVGGALLTYILITRWYLKKSSTEGGREPDRHARLQLKGLSLMGFIIGLLILSFVTRVVIVYIQFFEPITHFGDSVYYGVGTLLNESAGCLLVIVVTLMSFMRSRMVVKNREMSQKFLMDEDREDAEVPAMYRDY